MQEKSTAETTDEELETFLSERQKKWEADVEAQKHEIWNCKIGDILELTAPFAGSGPPDDDPDGPEERVEVLARGQNYRAYDRNGRGWDLELVSGEGPRWVRVMNSQVPRFFRVLAGKGDE